MSASVVSSMAGSYAAYAAAAAALDPLGRARVWQGLHLTAHPGLFAFVGQVNDDAGERGSVGGADLTARSAIVREAEPRAATLVTRLAGELAGLLGADSVPVVLLAGTTAANGWVDVYEGRPTLFLELSQLPPAPYDAVLVAHELTHVAHQRRRAGVWPETVAALLFAEGLATAVSRDLVPGLGDAGYLWFAAGHQPWLDACAAAYPTVAAELAGVLESTDPVVGRRLFSAGAGHSGTLPVRAGYYAGLRLIAEMRVAEGDIALAGSDLAGVTASLHTQLSSRGRR